MTDLTHQCVCLGVCVCGVRCCVSVSACACARVRVRGRVRVSVYLGDRESFRCRLCNASGLSTLPLLY